MRKAEAAQALALEIARLDKEIEGVRDTLSALRQERKEHLRALLDDLTTKDKLPFPEPAKTMPNAPALLMEDLAFVGKSDKRRFDDLVEMHGNDDVLSAVARLAGIEGKQDEPLRIGAGMNGALERHFAKEGA